MDQPKSIVSKKRHGAGNTSVAKKSKNGSTTEDLSALHQSIGYSSMSLLDVHDRIHALCRKVPVIPANSFELAGKSNEKQSAADDTTEQDGKQSASKEEGGKVDWNADIPSFLPRPAEPCRYDRKALREWATALQTVLEEFYLLVALVSPATYRWGADRSGAAEQNLSLLSNEFVRSQEQITARVTTRLNDVLAPVVTLVTEKTISTKDKVTDEEVKRNFFVTTYEDPDYVHLAYTILARNSSLLRQIVLANFDKLLRAITDYLAAQKKDSQHDARGLVY